MMLICIVVDLMHHEKLDVQFKIWFLKQIPFLICLFFSFQDHWVLLVGSVIRRPGGPTAARSCVVGGATTPHA